MLSLLSDTLVSIFKRLDPQDQREVRGRSGCWGPHLPRVGLQSGQGRNVGEKST